MRLALDAVSLDELRSQNGLVLRDVVHVEDFFTRPDVPLRIAVAVEAPLHGEGRGLVDEVHPVDAAVAARAADALGHVDVVAEVDEVGQAVDAAPDDRLAGAEAGADRLEHLRVGPDLRVAVHAGRGRRDAGEVRSLDRGVAVTAVDAEAGHVMLMAERYRLLAMDALIGEVGRTDDAADDPENKTGNEDRAKDGDARKRIGTTVENLRHLGCYRPVSRFQLQMEEGRG